MKLTVVGCSGSVCGPDSPASCYLVQAPYQDRIFSVVLDLGPGSFGALYRYLDPAGVDAVCLSHLHPDHCLDLCAFYVAARYSPTAPWPSIPVYAPPGAGPRMGRAYEVSDPDGRQSEHGPGIAGHFAFTDWAPRQRLGPFVVSVTQVAHPVETYAIRLDEVGETAEPADGGSLVFSGDTGPCPGLIELARGADLLLAEAAFMDSPGNASGVHLNGREAAEHAAAAGVSSLLLTHIPPWHDPDRVLSEAIGSFGGPVALAEPGAEWILG